VARESVRELGRVLPDRIRLLASLVARKPRQFSPEWASTIDDAFRLYTNTSTIDLLNSINRLLIDREWPFPPYVDLRFEMTHGMDMVFEVVERKWRALPSVFRHRHTLSFVVLSAFASIEKGQHELLDQAMIGLFRRHRKAMVRRWMSSDVIGARSDVIGDVAAAYERKLWAAAITTAVPLLERIMRRFFDTERLNVTIQVVRDAFMNVAGLRPEDLMPGFAVWDGQRDPAKGNTFAASVEEDLRLPGVFLSSFLEFADRYYGWYKSTISAPESPLNRHAIMHGASGFRSEANAARILTFIDLTLALQPLFLVLIKGIAPAENRGA
jgi:hypothetical protein